MAAIFRLEGVILSAAENLSSLLEGYETFRGTRFKKGLIKSCKVVDGARERRFPSGMTTNGQVANAEGTLDQRFPRGTSP